MTVKEEFPNTYHLRTKLGLRHLIFLIKHRLIIEKEHKDELLNSLPMTMLISVLYNSH